MDISKYTEDTSKNTSRWQQIEEIFRINFTDGETPDLDTILFLIGVQELGQGKKKFKKDDKLNFYVKIDKSKNPRYPVDQKYYSEQLIEGIDIISDCYTYFEKLKEKEKQNPLYIVDEKEVNEEFIRELKPEDVNSINVLKDKSAIEKYGEKGKNGVIEIKLKKK